MSTGTSPDDRYSERLHGGDRRPDYRDAYARDCDRLLYSAAFRRLSGVTQVVSADETQLFHNRLTHTLKVAQVAERLTQWLRQQYEERIPEAGLEPLAARAGALAHDLGHPPFGHIGEEVLRDLLDARGVNGFEGNPQSFRVVTKLSWRVRTPGLNLTRRSLRAILKYPWMRGKEEGEHEWRKWGAYDVDSEPFEFATEIHDGVSLEASIMDWADDITYAVHDLEDFYRAGLTPLARLTHDQKELNTFVARAAKALQEYDAFEAREAVDGLQAALEQVEMESSYSGTVKQRQRLHRTASNLITRFVGETSLDPLGRLNIPVEIWHEVNMLKQLTWHYVIDRPELATIQEGQKRLIRELFECLTAWASESGGEDRQRLPTRFRDGIKSIEGRSEERTVLENDAGDDNGATGIYARAAADYIASLTEAQAIELHARLTGGSSASVLQGWVRMQ